MGLWFLLQPNGIQALWSIAHNFKLPQRNSTFSDHKELMSSLGKWKPTEVNGILQFPGSGSSDSQGRNNRF